MNSGCSELNVIAETIPSSLSTETNVNTTLNTLLVSPKTELECVSNHNTTLSVGVSDIYSQLKCDCVNTSSTLSIEFTCVIGAPYLEINPTILWILPDLHMNSNDVYSNTHWFIN